MWRFKLEKKKQANLTPQKAASLWSLVADEAATLGAELVSPAVNFCAGSCNMEVRHERNTVPYVNTCDVHVCARRCRMLPKFTVLTGIARSSCLKPTAVRCERETGHSQTLSTQSTSSSGMHCVYDSRHISSCSLLSIIFDARK